MSNIKVSSDIDTFLKKSTKEEAASFLGLENSGQVETNKTNIATNTADIATNTADIATNTSKVGITPAQASAIAANTLKDGITTAQATAIATNTSDITSHSAQLILNRDYSDALQVEVDANYDSIALLGSTLPNGITQNSNNIATNAADISTLQSDKAPLASPILTGNPTAPTQNANDDSTKIATTAYVDAVTSPNNKGFFATESALTTGYPTGQNGWFAIVGATDTFWVWDSDTTAWVNTGTSSQGTVTSINITGGTGITPSGGPVTSSGSITVGLDSTTQATLAKVTTNESAIQTNTANIATNTAGISNLATAVTSNTNYISAVAPTITGHTTAIATNTASISTNASAIALNTAKVGITSAQAQAIIDNTAKTGITSGQASAIVANTAKIGITPDEQDAIEYNRSDIASNTTNIATNATNIATNATNIATKAPIASPDFTGTVGMGKTGLSGVLDINGNVYIENGKIEGDTGSLDFDGNQAQLILGTVKSDAIKVSRVDANSTQIFKVDASTASPLVTMINAEVDGDLKVENDLTVNGYIEVDGETTFKADVIVNNGDITVSDTSGNGTGGKINAKDVTVSNKLYVKEIQAIGSTGSTTQPIVYDSMEHRFRDFDADPTNLMVIQKFNGYTGARIGINKNPSASSNVTLEIVAGLNNSTGEKDEALKVIGRSFFNESIRVGHYSDATRPTPSVAQNGMIIYNSDHNEFQGFQAVTGWVKFSTEAVST